jgi:hypothetical protein
MDMDRDRAFAALRRDVARLPWTFAKTVPHTPHFYIVRARVPDEIFVRLFVAIGRYGVDQYYAPFRNRYLYLGDGFKYWRQMRDHDVRWARLLNRNDVLDPADWYPGPAKNR